MRKIHDNVKNLISLTEYTLINNDISDIIVHIIIYDKKNEIMLHKILNKRRQPHLDVLLLSPFMNSSLSFMNSCSCMITNLQLDMVLMIN